MLSRINPSQTPEWSHLRGLANEFERLPLKERVHADPSRADRYRLEVGGLVWDYSRSASDDAIWKGLEALAERMELSVAIEAYFKGAPINETEGRAVLHTALRSSETAPLLVQGRDVRPDIAEVLGRMGRFSEEVLSGTLRGWTGKRIQSVINIGIGGSDLGPAMAYEALRAHRRPEVEVYYVSNVDGSHLAPLLEKRSADECLFIIASKTFTTQETMANAEAAKRWMLEQGMPEGQAERHFCALSTNAPAVAAFGIHPDRMFPFWDWVGGRYSMWSAIGLSLSIGLGHDRFLQLLKGAEAMDHHFRQAPWSENLPVKMGLLGLWYRNFLSFPSLAILPYDQNLHRFAAYLQQTDMESNGKSVGRDGHRLDYPTAPLVWGEPGTNGQHAFYQSLHQGFDRIPMDFLASVRPSYALGQQHSMLLANLLAQAEAFMNGLNPEEARKSMQAEGLDPSETERLLPYRVFQGNRPSTILWLPELSPYYLGMLVASYEHKIFVQGVLWNVFSFDQWGVELGKKLAKPIFKALLEQNPSGISDPFTRRNLEQLLSAEFPQRFDDR
ncbi:glucose-6-phosphate isomerase [bacterium]|nr:glucose-6-phosphate isomerase [bacterium]